jgi:anaerobic ribonucleoside-triphosphate reductase activating protein
MTSETALLNLAAWQERSYANGPGARYVLWVQGCDLSCPGCSNPGMQPREPRHVMTVHSVVQAVCAAGGGVEGVTYTGGEPMLQAHALALISEPLREHGLSVFCFTGCRYETLAASPDPWIRRLLASVDVLVDGPFVREEASNLLWRGSRNQRILFLSERYRHLEERTRNAPAEVEVIIRDGELVVTGTWPADLARDTAHILGRQPSTDGWCQSTRANRLRGVT